MKKFINLLTLVAVLLVGQISTAYSQAQQPTFTTLSSAIADARATRIAVTSATGFVASTGTLDYGLFVDNEFMRITAVSGTSITVQRGQSNTNATAHPSGAYVVVGQYGSQQAPGVAGGPFVQNKLAGTCSRSDWPYMPLIQVNANAIGGQAMYDCIGAVWRPQTLISQISQPSLYKACTVPIGSVAYGSFGTSITPGTTSQYTASVFVPSTIIATGITELNGSAVDTGSKKIVIAYGLNGQLLANSATAGTAATGSDAFQAIPFTTPRILVGPSYYFLALQDDTADANGLRMVATATFNNVIAGVTTSVFGTVAASITAPTTFTADQGPIACLY